jgi:FixJ family two-component response regulator
MTVRAMKAGAVEFLTKPFRPQELLDAVHDALKRYQGQHQNAALLSELRQRFATLTPREQQVMACITGRLLNKQTAAEMGVTEHTVKLHRRQAIRKMGAQSLAELVRMAALLGTRRG